MIIESAMDKKEEGKKEGETDNLLDQELIQKTIKNITGSLAKEVFVLGRQRRKRRKLRM